MKQRLLFVIDSLGVGGAEKSLVNFLSVLDYERFNVDLQLFAYGGAFERFLPKEVHLLAPLSLIQVLKKSFWKQLLSFNIPLLWARYRYSLSIHKPNVLHTDRARLYWKFFSQYIKKNEFLYDVAIAYGQNLPTLYVADKILSKKKFAWINVSYSPKGVNYSYYKSCYFKFDYIVTVSPSAKEAFVHAYPEFQSQTVVIRDIYDGKTIERMSLADCQVHLESGVPILLTMARLKKEQKGYDISLEACRLLKDRGIRFRWYALGEGPYRAEMEQFIAENQLQDTFILLGALANPYPVLRQCTLYVQTSRYEGFGLSIAEARILNKPVVTTEFDAVYAQMVHGDNGLVVPQDPVAVADAIERMLNDAALYQHIVNYQKQEKKGNIEEIEKFYQLIDSKHEASAAI